MNTPRLAASSSEHVSHSARDTGPVRERTQDRSEGRNKKAAFKGSLRRERKEPVDFVLFQVAMRRVAVGQDLQHAAAEDHLWPAAVSAAENVDKLFPLLAVL